MASINIKIFQHEKDALVDVIRKNKEAISVSDLAKQAGLNPNRSRFIIEELLQEGKIKRIVVKAFNPRYIRYRYEVTK